MSHAPSLSRTAAFATLAALAFFACDGDDSTRAAFDAGPLPDVGSSADGSLSPDAPAGDGATGAETGTYDSGFRSDGGGYDTGTTDASQTPTLKCDGVVEFGEYGSSAHQQAAAPSQVWYMTWDAQNLYVAITSAKISEAAILYLSSALGVADAGADASADAGDDSGADAGADAGAPAGQLYDGTRLAHIGFPPKLVVYAKDGYNEYRTADAAGTWSAAQSNKLQVCSAGTAREIVIPWSVLTSATRPPSFAWVSYLTSSTGYVYGQLPTDNPGMTIGTSAQYPWFYAVPDTATSTPFTDKRSN
jgi:hypothetical protein